ncbi:MAG: hypothetical protein IKL52_03765 [Candidatus Gastranaerophilales bacterium]|nr:hypothetical protein [Candidatus Gastranaerophilales bacterium]
MKKRYLGLIIVFAGVCMSLLLFGCENNKIEFYRESKAQALLNKFSTQQQNKPTVRSGVIILKDDSSKNSTINFGPRDINFDLPVRIK